MKKYLLLSLLIVTTAILNAQNKNQISIAFYNVENLFDTINDPITKDDEFTPTGNKKWSFERYEKKLTDISDVLSAIGNGNLPDITGFAEIENRKVLDDLLSTDNKSEQYKIIHEESPDARGIDVGLIYNIEKLNYLNHKKIPVHTGSEYKVRDILYARFILDHIDTLHVFVNHWKSRSGGQEQTEPERIQCAETLKGEIDSIRKINSMAKIIAVGDFNDTPNDISIFKTLMANNSNDPGALTNLMLPIAEQGLGTHSYRGNWSALDQIIVSKSLINGDTGYTVLNSEAHIFSADWITFTSKQGTKSPNRTYGGNNYYGGYSDHYPVYTILKKK